MQTFWDNRDTLESVPQFDLGSVWHKLEYQWDVCRVVCGLTSASLTAQNVPQYFFVFVSIAVTMANQYIWQTHHNTECHTWVGSTPVSCLGDPWFKSCPRDQLVWLKCFASFSLPKQMLRWYHSQAVTASFHFLPKSLFTHRSIQHYWATDSS